MQKFLLAIIKQLDLKCVEWNEVAEATGITNGHAARMRWSRYKKQMEGHVPKPRGPRVSKAKTPSPTKGTKNEDEKPVLSIKSEQVPSDETFIPRDASQGPEAARGVFARTPPSTPKTHRIKNEPCDDSMAGQIPLPLLQIDNGAHSPGSRPEVGLLAMPIERAGNQNSPSFDDNSLMNFNLGNQIFSSQFPTTSNSHYQSSPSSQFSTTQMPRYSITQTPQFQSAAVPQFQASHANSFMQGVIDYSFPPDMGSGMGQHFSPVDMGLGSYGHQMSSDIASSGNIQRSSKGGEPWEGSYQ